MTPGRPWASGKLGKLAKREKGSSEQEGEPGGSWLLSVGFKSPMETWEQPRCPSADEWIRKLWYIYTMEYYSAIKKNSFESVLTRWMKLEPIIQSEVSQKDKDRYSILTHIYGI